MHDPTDEEPSEDSGAEFDEGRYLYCLVAVGEGADDDAVAADGLDGATTELVRTGGVGAVVHTCESTYDSDNPRQVRRWLLAHQRVVDEAGEAFGTPIPFRFHTILPGDDGTVRQWLDEVRADARVHLDELSNRWEYRISLNLDEERLGDELAAEDEELRSLRARTEQADAGTSFLLEKQYDQQLRKRLREHRQELLEALRRRIAPHVERAEVLGRRRATLDGVDAAEQPAQRVAALARDAEVDALGAALDEVAANPGVEIEFTGPWPPYTFAPEFAAESPDDAEDPHDEGTR
ncbi:Gas vesicle synthesis protein GvpL/GvpF [Natronoarchaeum philippinense]|uniref:Gas vesicle synthesis protein GvpL/GvpF n=1 Tax=Natronoarchaeum philippinense TaxID=558529 RepID=A0A285NVD1_NATPI|nr:GvpL/GvpF family gas vesicle protein [Natronoarchaeum philippinense]SNZ13399.1 Gas vesicle synthesis protein GvpL/GvpF [Natronoarchaeum philippinense]